MRYMMLINLGPKARDWQSLSEDERRLFERRLAEITSAPSSTSAA